MSHLLQEACPQQGTPGLEQVSHRVSEEAKPATSPVHVTRRHSQQRVTAWGEGG